MTRILAPAALVFATATLSSGVNVLYQNDPTGDTFAFEAENYSTFEGTNWSQVVDTTTDPLLSGASGGAGLWVTGPNGSNNGNSTGGGPRYPNQTNDRIEYELFFASPGTYNFYVRGLEPADGNAATTAFAEGWPNGNNDSFWPHGTFGSSLTTNTNYTDGSATFGHPAGDNNAFGWDNRGVQITVTPAQVGQPIPWAWTWREDGPIIDRFVFSKTTLDDAALDAVMNVPEPSRVVLLGIAALALVMRRRR